MFLIDRLSFISTGDTLNTLVEVVLNWRTAFGLLALCSIKVSNAKKIISIHQDGMCRLTLLKLLFWINRLLFLFLLLVTTLTLLLFIVVTLRRISGINTGSRLSPYLVF